MLFVIYGCLKRHQKNPLYLVAFFSLSLCRFLLGSICPDIGRNVVRCPFAAVAVIPILELHLWWCHYVNTENLGNHQKTKISAVCDFDDITLFCVFVCFFFSPILSPLCFAFHLAHSASLARQPAFATCSVCLASATVCLSPPSSQPFFMSSSVVRPCQICRRHF